MKSKVLYLDTETTGLDPHKNGVIQVAMIGPDNKTFNVNINPIPLGVKIDKEALKINGIKKKWIKKYPDSSKQFKKMLKFMKGYVDQYNKTDKMVVIGYNVKFDVEFLHGWAKREEFDFMGSFIDWRVIDVLVLARTAHYLGQMPAEPEDFKLGTICKVYGIKEPSHDAMDDIVATKMLFERITNEWTDNDSMPF